MATGDIFKVITDANLNTAVAEAIASDTEQNFLTEDQVTKLDSAELNAKDDQTGPEIKALYEAELDTNAYTDAEKVTVSNQTGINTGDQNALTVGYDNTDSGLTSATVKEAIDEVEDTKVANSRVLTDVPAGAVFTDTTYTNVSSFTNDSAYLTEVLEADVTAHQAAITITESQISDLGDYEVADATILKDADIGVNVQAYNIDTIIDADYVQTEENYTTIDKTLLDSSVPLSTTATTIPTGINEIVDSVATLNSTVVSNSNDIEFIHGDIGALTDTVASLSSAQANVTGAGSVLLPLDGTALGLTSYTVVTDSTDTDVMTLDGTTGEYTFKVAGKYSFTTNLYVKAAKDTIKTIRIQMLDDLDHELVNQTIGATAIRKEGTILPVSTIINISQADLDVHGGPIIVDVLMSTVEVETDTGQQVEVTGFDAVLATMSIAVEAVVNHSGLTGTSLADSHPATAISVTPNGNLTSTEVQSALSELQDEIDTLTTITEW